MALWVDKYRPKSLETLSHSAALTSQLESLTMAAEDLPHILFYGTNGGGKKTRCMALLAGIFGQGVFKLKIDVRQFVTPSNKKLELNVVSSPYHLEVTPSDMGNNDRIVVQELLKEIAQMEHVDFQSNGEGLSRRYKVVVINEAESLTRDAQAALRRTMEKYSRNIRIIMICETMSNIIAPIKSRCMLVRVPAPLLSETVRIMENICSVENVEANENKLYEIANFANGNLRVALLTFESICLQNDLKLTESTALINPDWMVVVQKLAAMMMRERNVAYLVECRATLYDLLSHCIPASIILHEMAFALLKNVHSDHLKLLVIHWASICDERLALGNKAIYHLEGFLGRIMYEIETSLLMK
ncbi:HBL170Wp [Eremothecium sinecaudum]|uniref:HBL170Wp n=1 Tax=Eremothecium sinecaudum TaxID=45286 RepID=A0A109UWQ6_9SACH|nr:HBL170Wp [Eremothecium sinecaudum]AMD18732.1 HBL170Wp [Eremothecium sinecaudum]